MNDFNEKWKHCVRRAGRVTREPDPMPWGFPERILARVKTETTPQPETIWLRMGMRTLTGLAVLLLIGLSLQFRQAQQGLVRPHMEDTITQLFWLL